MSKHIKKFETQAAYEAAFASLDLPNVSLIVEGRQVEYNSTIPPAPVETKVVCIVSASTTEEPTSFFDSYSNPGSSFSSMEIDDVEQSEILNDYVFDTTGLHTLKFTLIDETSIYYDAFKVNEAKSIISITIPSSVTSIGSNAFYGSSSLSSITIPSGVTSIGDSAFQGCSSLSNITIPSGVTSIENAVFYDCTSLSSITIPSGVTSIGNTAFSTCSSLLSINYQGTISQWESISKDETWNQNMDSDARVYCTDGDIPVFNE